MDTGSQRGDAHQPRPGQGCHRGASTRRDTDRDVQLTQRWLQLRLQLGQQCWLRSLHRVSGLPDLLTRGSRPHNVGVCCSTDSHRSVCATSRHAQHRQAPGTAVVLLGLTILSAGVRAVRSRWRCDGLDLGAVKHCGFLNPAGALPAGAFAARQTCSRRQPPGDVIHPRLGLGASPFFHQLNGDSSCPKVTTNPLPST